MKPLPVYIEQLKKVYYPDKVVLNDIDLSVNDGESIGILGCNGSGKTTLLRILATLINHSYGIIEIFGLNPCYEATKIKEMIGYLPERFSFYPYFSVLDVLNFFEKLTPMNRIDKEENKEQLIKILGIEPFLDAKIKALSKGMLHKVGLAIILIHDPPLLLLDEPTSGLDPLVRREVRSILINLQKNTEKTVLISSHILEDVEAVCNRVFFLEEGKMIYWPFEISEMNEKLKKLSRVEIWLNDKIKTSDLKELKEYLHFTRESRLLQVYCFKNEINNISCILESLNKSKVEIITHRINLEDIYVLNNAKVDWVNLLE